MKATTNLHEVVITHIAQSDRRVKPITLPGIITEIAGCHVFATYQKQLRLSHNTGKSSPRSFFAIIALPDGT